MDQAEQKEYFSGHLLEWYMENKRDLPWRRHQDPYYIWVSEIMLQQTRVDTVIPYFNRFIERFPTVEALADAPEQDVLKCWEGLGYYSRARNLQAAAKQVKELHGGQVPDDRAAVFALKGVGPYTAGRFSASPSTNQVSGGRQRDARAVALFFDRRRHHERKHEGAHGGTRHGIDPRRTGFGF